MAGKMTKATAMKKYEASPADRKADAKGAAKIMRQANKGKR